MSVITARGGVRPHARATRLPGLLVALLLALGVLAATSPPASAAGLAVAEFVGLPPSQVVGRVTFTDIGADMRVTGQWNQGFLDPNVAAYRFLIVNTITGHTDYDLTNDIASQIHISVPGTSPFVLDLPNVQVLNVITKTFVITANGTRIGSAVIVGV
jgi:hypothetical protein